MLKTEDPASSGELEITESCETLSPDRLEQARSAFLLKMRGNTQEQIAVELGVSRSTIVRLLNDYKKLYAEQLSSEPRLHLLTEELAKLDDVVSTARTEAATTTNARDKQGFMKIALQAMKSHHELLLETGVLPREPSKLVAVSCSLRAEEEYKGEERTLDEIKADVKRLLRNGRTI